MNIFNYAAYIFDFDGTLVDSMGIWKQIDVDYLSENNIACPPDLAQDIVAMGIDELTIYFKNRFNLPHQPNEIKSRWLEMAYHRYMERVPFKAGATEFILHLSKRNKPLSVATACYENIVEDYLVRQNMRHYFKDLFFTMNIKKEKPEPDVYLQAAKHLGVQPKDCLVFEDTLEGVQAGKSAGMTVIAVADSFQKNRQDIIDLSDAFIQDFTTLLTKDSE